ncbi:MAG: hypothetical protein HAW66_06155 [Shewanella sp.]|nr:hypothetical protein [Shewanella sp.]
MSVSLSEAIAENGLERSGRQTFKVNEQCYSVDFNENSKVTSVNFITESVKKNNDFLFITANRTPTCPEFLDELNSKAVLKLHDEKLSKIYSGKKLHKDYDALCFSGGGAKGVSYAGVVQVLGTERLKTIKETSGASAGSLIATAIACGMTHQQVSDWILAEELQFNEASIEAAAISVISTPLQKHVHEIANILCECDYPLLDENESEIPKEKIDGNSLKFLTFRQLDILKSHQAKPDDSALDAIYLKRLVIVATMNKNVETELSARKTPDLPIYLAVKASCTSPIGMRSVEIDSKYFGSGQYGSDSSNTRRASLTDGGLTNNTPHSYLQGQNTLAIAFDSAQELQNRDLNIVEKSVQKIFGSELFKSEMFDIAAAKNNPKITLCFISPSIGTFDFKKAIKDFFFIKWQVADQFIKNEEVLSYANRFQLLSDERSINERFSDETLKSTVTPYLKKKSEFINQEQNSKRADQRRRYENILDLRSPSSSQNTETAPSAKHSVTPYTRRKQGFVSATPKLIPEIELALAPDIVMMVTPL